MTVRVRANESEPDRIAKAVRALVLSIRAEVLIEDGHPLRRRPPREPIGPCAAYEEYKLLMGIKRPA